MAKKATPKKAQPKSYKGQKRIFWFLVLLPIFGLLGLLFIAYLGDLPPTESLSNPKTNLATEVLTSDNQVLGRYYKENRTDIKFENLPPHLVQALIATEDARYYDHSGVDFIGLARAIFFLGKKGGGSTLTQQLAKMLFTETSQGFFERAVLQKPREWIIATRLERQYTKNEIISLYLNRYDFLNQAVGIKSAAQVYFNKPVEELNVEESAMLVGMLKNSSLYNPLKESRKEIVIKRREVVLSQMARYDFIEQATYDSLRQMPLGLDYQRVSHDEGAAPYFREVLRQQVKKILNEKDADGNYIRTKSEGVPYDLYQDGLEIHTTIDSRMQAYAEFAVNEHIANHLQEDFFKDLKKRRDANYPFYNGIKDKDRDRIMASAVKGSHRYLAHTGKWCPDCERPGSYISAIKVEGKNHWHCDPKKGGCDHQWAELNEKEIEANFAKEIAMKIFTHAGVVDTVLSPLDSIKHLKSFLHAGMMAMEPHTGYVKAYVGGVNFKQFQYDNVGQSKRQVGSTFKPFVYATAIRFGEEPCHEYPNQRVCVETPEGQPDWCPENSDKKYGNMVSLEYALANSINTVTARLIKKYGVKPVVKLAKDLGIQQDLPEVPSIALGTAELTLKEMVAANSALVNKGVYIEPILITHITDKNGNTIYSTTPNTREALDERSAYLTVNMMQGVVKGAYNRDGGKITGTGTRLRFDSPYRDYDNITYPTAGKTGTTQNNTDGWFMGLTPDLVTGVWVGGADPAVRFSTTSLGQGANMALPIYGYFMNKVYADEKLQVSKGNFPKPDGELNVETDCQKYFEENRKIDFGFDELDDDGLFE